MYKNYYSYYPCSEPKEIIRCKGQKVTFTSEAALFAFLQKLPSGSKFVCFVPLFGGDHLASVTGEIYDGKIQMW